MVYVASSYANEKLYNHNAIVVQREIKNFKDLAKNKGMLDITFTVNKSISVVGLAHPNEMVRFKVQEAYRKALEKTVNYLKKYNIYIYSKKEHRYKIPNSDAICTNIYIHKETRNGDPHLHAHVVIDRNILHEGKFYKLSKGYIDSSKVNSVFNILLAQELVQDGFKVKIENGQVGFDIPEQLNTEFSQKTMELRKTAESILAENPNIEKDKIDKILRKEVLFTKEKKNEEKTPEVLTQEWVSKFESILKKNNFSEKEFNDCLFRQLNFPKEGGKLTISQCVKIALNSLKEKREVFYLSDAFRYVFSTIIALKDGLEEEVDLEKVEMEIRRQAKFLGVFDNVVIKDEKHQVVKEVFTFKDLHEGHELFKGIIKKYIKIPVKIMGKRESKEKIKEFEVKSKIKLNHEQVRFIQGVLDGNKIEAVVGDPGTGKTTVLKALKHCLEDTPYSVLGCAPTKAASEVMKENDINSYTIAMLLKKIEQSIKYGRTEDFKNMILVIDESSMIDTDTFIKLMNYSHLFKKIIYIGDYKQLQPIQSGIPFTKLLAFLPHKNIFKFTKIVRQKDKKLKYVVERLCNPYSFRDFLDKFDVISNIQRKKILSQKDLFFAISERLGEIYANKKEKKNGHVFITKSHKNKDLINKMVRSFLIKNKKINLKKSATVYTYVPTMLDRQDKLNIDNHSLWQKIHFNESVEIPTLARKEGWLKKIDKEKKEVILNIRVSGKTYREVRLSISEYLHACQEATIYALKKLNVAVGETLVALKNDYKNNIVNGESCKVTSIYQKGNKTFVRIEGSIGSITMEANTFFNQYNFFDYGYCITIMKSQGGTFDNATFINFKDEHLTHNDILVAFSRARENLQIYTENPDRIINAISLLQKKDDYSLYQEAKNELSNMVNELSRLCKDKQEAKEHLYEIINGSLSPDQKQLRIISFLQSELLKKKSLTRRQVRDIVNSLSDKIVAYLYAIELYPKQYKINIESAINKKRRGEIKTSFESICIGQKDKKEREN